MLGTTINAVYTMKPNRIKLIASILSLHDYYSHMEDNYNAIRGIIE
jgi:hypothetical protein